MKESGCSLAIRGVQKNYGKKTALAVADLTFTAGVYGLLGPNGAGKTTLLNILATVLPPDVGHVYCNGREIGRMGAEYRAMLGYLPQKMDFYDHFTGYDFLSYMYLLKGGKEKRPAQLEALLRRVHLYDVRNEKTGSYSGGMKQRLAIAQAFIGSPAILLLDEPTVGLDLEERAEFKEMVRGQRERATVILSTHIVSDVEETADHIVFINDGRILETNTMDYYRAYMAEHGMDGLERYYLQLAGRRLNEADPV